MRRMLDLRPTHNPHRFTLAVTPGVAVGPPEAMFLFGGAGLAAAVAALEAATGRPAVWATAQYLSYARPPSILDLDVIVPVSGKHTTQARVVGHVGETEILTVNAALGSRPMPDAMQWATMPEVPRPEDCALMEYGWRRSADDINGRFEQRVAKGRYGTARRDGGPSADGHSALWVRAVDPDVVIDRVALALIADFLPSGVGNAMGQEAGGNSLDNTIRYCRHVPTRWVLCDIHIEAIAGGFGHGRMRLFAEDGTLLATASQSVIIRA